MNYYYEYDYGFEPSAGEAFGSAVGAVLGVVLVFYLLLLAFGVVSYVLQSLGMYTIAKRRGIRNPWLSWLPVGNMWILGSISDQYQYVAKGRVRNRRKVLMGLTIAMLASLIPMYISFFASIFSEVAALDASETLLGMTVGVMLITYLFLVVISVVAMVYQYMALYDLYVSCEPSNGVLYLVLSIFASIAMPFFIFACRKKDMGMPPRKTVQQEPPVLQSVAEPVTVDETETVTAEASESVPVQEQPEQEDIAE